MRQPPPPQQSPGSPPELVDDAMREIFLRVPADDPKSLVRAAAVCTSWRGILSDDAFARQYRAFHGAPPMLGFLRTKRCYVRRPCPSKKSWGKGRNRRYTVSDFVSTASFRPPACHERHDWDALDSRHGLVLFHTPKEGEDFVICDLVTYDQWGIKANEECSNIIISYDDDDDDEADVGITWSATVLCAKDRCDHLYCHGGPFLVALLGCHEEQGITFASVYSSETRKWSDMIFIEKVVGIERAGCTALVGNKVYFPSTNIHCIVEYDMGEQELSVIDVPFVVEDEFRPYAHLMGVEHGMLLFANVLKSKLCLWSVEAGSSGALALAGQRVIELEPLLPTYALVRVVVVIGFAEGVGVVFLSTEAGMYTVELSSGRTKKVHVDTSPEVIVPYMSFYTRAWGRLPTSD